MTAQTSKSARLLVLSALALFFTSVATAVPVKERELDWVLKRTPDLQNGARLYETCAACHGAGGEGVADGSVPTIGGQGFVVVAKQIVDFRSGVRRDPRMEQFTDVHHLAYSQYIADVSAYVSGLRPALHARTAPVETIGRGAVLYARSCERCHGIAGEGNDDELTPRLASQHYEYLVRQINDSATPWRPVMQEKHAILLAKLPQKDREAIASYLSSVTLP